MRSARTAGAVILFDGVCPLCTRTVRFVLKRDTRRIFSFASIQSEKGGELYRTSGFRPEAIETFVLIEGDRAYTKSDAALRIVGKLSAPWPALGVFWIVPKPVRDRIYDFIARNRYRWFGKYDACLLPSKEEAERFI